MPTTGKLISTPVNLATIRGDGVLMRVVVLGASLAGIVAARLIMQGSPSSSVTILEPSAVLGGAHLRGVNYGSAGPYFDFGAHTLQECGIEPMDAVLRGSPARVSLHKRDLAGVHYAEKLQSDSRFPDLRDRPDIAHIRGEVYKRILEPGGLTIDRCASLNLVALDRFGPSIGNEFADAVSRSLSIEREALAGYALELFGLQRVILDDRPTWEQNCSSARYRATVGHPEPESLPGEFAHGRRTIYGATFGTRDVVGGVVDQLANVAVETRIQDLSVDLRAQTISFRGHVGAKRSVSWDWLLVGLPLTRFLGTIRGDDNTERILKKVPTPAYISHAFVNVVASPSRFHTPHYWTILNTAPELGPFRVTNYRALDLQRGVPTRYTAEFINPQTSDGSMVRQALEHLRAVGALRRDVDPEFVHVERVPAGFLLPTTENLSLVDKGGREAIRYLPADVSLIGSGVSTRQINQSETFRNVYRVLTEVMGMKL